MAVKIWRVEFGGNYAAVEVAARNVIEAMKRAISVSKSHGEPIPRSQPVTSVRLIAEGE